jgi:hypothetical protein
MATGPTRHADTMSELRAEQTIDARGVRAERETWLSREVQSLLRDVHGDDKRVRCLCRPGGVPMGIRQREGVYRVYRLPDSGPQHAVSCRSFEDPLVVGGRAAYKVDPITVLDDATFELNLVRPAADAPAASHGDIWDDVEPSPEIAEKREHGRRNLRRDRMSLVALAHWLWQHAQLNYWPPNHRGLRTWDRVRAALIDAAGDVRVHDTHSWLALVLPEGKESPDPAGRADRFMTQLQANAQRPVTTYSVVIGDVKTTRTTNIGEVVELWGLPSLGFRARDREWGAALGRCRAEAELIERSPRDREDRIVAVMQCVPAEGAPSLVDIKRIEFMRVTRQWIPVDSDHESLLCSQLARQRRDFMKPLRFDAPASLALANFALLDAGERPVPLRIRHSSPGRPARHAATAKAKAADEPATWWWDVHTSPQIPPALPAARTCLPRLPRADAATGEPSRRDATPAATDTHHTAGPATVCGPRAPAPSPAVPDAEVSGPGCGDTATPGPIPAGPGGVPDPPSPERPAAPVQPWSHLPPPPTHPVPPTPGAGGGIPPTRSRRVRRRWGSANRRRPR